MASTPAATAPIALRRVVWRLAALALLTAILTGCQSILTLGYLIGGPPSSDPDFHQKTKQSLDKKGTTVLVYCYAPKELKWDNERLDYDVAKHLAHQLMQRGIAVIDPDRVAAWLDKHDKWSKVSEIGKAFKVDYVIHVDVKDYSLFEPRSPNLYRGHADVMVHVVKMDESRRDGNMIYTTGVKSHFPTRGPVDQNQMSLAEFKKRYLSALTFEIGTLFFSTETGDEIPYGYL